MIDLINETKRIRNIPSSMRVSLEIYRLWRHNLFKWIYYSLKQNNEKFKKIKRLH